MRKQDKQLLMWGGAAAAAYFLFFRNKGSRTPSIVPGYVPVKPQRFMPLPKDQVKVMKQIRQAEKHEAVPDDNGPLSPGQLWKEYNDAHEDDDLNDGWE